METIVTGNGFAEGPNLACVGQAFQSVSPASVAIELLEPMLACNLHPKFLLLVHCFLQPWRGSDLLDAEWRAILLNGRPCSSHAQPEAFA
eukprot:scaffold183381_cov10-Tisochrysis_lutea.AAC.1